MKFLSLLLSLSAHADVINYLCSPVDVITNKQVLTSQFTVQISADHLFANVYSQAPNSTPSMDYSVPYTQGMFLLQRSDIIVQFSPTPKARAGVLRYTTPHSVGAFVCELQ
jgi:hypothetical protein